MKTNQVLTRQMGSFSVYQRTKDGMFNATTLLKQWNQSSGHKKEVAKYFENPSSREFIEAIINEEFPSYAKNGYDKNTTDLVYVKSRANKGENAGTWMHPLLFIDFAMWLNPSFKVKVLKFVYDQLIQYRNEAGDTYIEMCAALKSISKPEEITHNIQKIARAINIVVFGKHQREARNKMAEELRMKELSSLQSKVAEMIHLGYLTTFEQVREYLLRVWSSKYQPKELVS